MTTDSVDRSTPSALDAILRKLTRSRLATETQPDVSVVIPVFNQWISTRACLIALLRVDVDVSLQVIVVDDASTDETPERLSCLTGIDVVRNGVNSGFVQSCNRGAAVARAPLIYFLNNDAMIRDGAVRALFRRMTEDSAIAVAGSKLLYPDGRLQEAGGIIWADGSGCNVGRDANANLSEYSFARDVDYVSGASLMVRSRVFHDLGGFDARFAPAYYEDADLCFSVRSQGHRVVYDPVSEVVHHEGLTSGTDLERGTKRFQSVNRAKFLGKWLPTLQREHLEPDTRRIREAARRRGKDERRILIIDVEVPKDRDAGGQRLCQLIAGFHDRGSRVALFPDDLRAVQPYTARLQHLGTEVIYDLPDLRRDPDDLLREAAIEADVIWLSRPLICRKYVHRVRSFTSCPIIYDTVDLHHVRLRGQTAFDTATDEVPWDEWRQVELACARAADGTVAVTEAEAQILREAGVPNVTVLPTIHDPLFPANRTFAATSGLIFIGGYRHRPNIDAAIWLVRKIMPLVWSRDPDIRLTLLGADPPWEVTELANDRVAVPGYLPDVTDYFRSARAFVAPLRYGAGVKGKIGQALSCAVPVITTTVGAEGFDFLDRVSAMIADTPGDFADAILAVYGDSRLWSRLAVRSFVVLEPFRSARVLDRAVAFIDDLISAARSSSR